MCDLGIVERIKDTNVPFYRPPIPQQESEGVDPRILTIMKQCWAEEPTERPSFVEVAKSLRTINKGKSVCFALFNVFVAVESGSVLANLSVHNYSTRYFFTNDVRLYRSDFV